MRAKTRQEVLRNGPQAVATLACGEDAGALLDTLRLVMPATSRRFQASDILIDPTPAMGELGGGDLFGSMPAIIVREAQAKHEKAIMALVEYARKYGGKIGVEAPSLALTTKLAKTFDAGSDLLLVPHYLLKDSEKQAELNAALSAAGMSTAGRTRSDIISRMSGARAEIARLAEVLAAHAKGCGRDKVLDADFDAAHLPGETPMHAPIDKALAGDAAGACVALRARLDANEEPIGILRGLSWRLMQIAQMHESGLPPRDAVQQARPPVFWLDRDALAAILGRTSRASVLETLRDITNTETQIMSAPILGPVLVERFLLAAASRTEAVRGARPRR